VTVYCKSLTDMIIKNNRTVPTEITFEFRTTKHDLGFLQVVPGSRPAWDQLRYASVGAVTHGYVVDADHDNLVFKCPYCKIKIKEDAYFYVVAIYKDFVWLPSGWRNRHALLVLKGDEIVFGRDQAPPPTFLQAIYGKITRRYYIARHQFRTWLKK